MAGNKLENLKILRDNGINVPHFTVVPFSGVVDVEKYEDLLKGQKNPDFGAVLSNCINYDFDLDEFYDEKEFPELCSVRSSCSVEDGESASFAGQFDTFLNVDNTSIHDRVIDVVKSLANNSVLRYVEENALSYSGLRMDVIVQEMIIPQLSGVIFSSNPQGILNEAVITVGEGTGDGIVESRVETTSYYCNRTDDVYYYEGKKNYLSPEMVHELLYIVDRIKELIGEFVDIEFAIRNHEVFILQARPITTLAGKHPLILDNSNIVESYPGMSLPLTVSFVKLVYGGVFKGVCRRVLKNDKELAKHEDVFYNMVGNANGRMYYKISNWYTVLKFLPFNKKIIPIWQEMLGVSNKTYEEDSVRLSLPLQITTYFNVISELKKVPKNMALLEEEFLKVYEDFYNKFRDDLPPAQLIRMFEETKRRLFDIWDVTLLNDTYAFIYTGLLKNHLRKKGRNEESVNEYVSGISGIKSMEPVNELARIALSKDKMTEEEYLKARKEYISWYGDRNLEELKIESKTFRTNPELFDEWVENVRSLEKMNRRRGKSMDDKAHISGNADLMTRYLAKHAALGIANREASRLNRCRVYGIVREIFLALGKQYAAAGMIEEQRDVFYLSIDEVFSMAKEPVDMRDRIRNRKERYQMFENLPAYSRLIFEAEEFDKHHKSVNLYERKQDKNKMRGIPCSSGRVTAEAIVIKDPSMKIDVEGKILVTKMTDPGWVFLLTAAAGVISEKGSLLSHTAIISRELGIPSIVGVDNLLEVIETGDIITMEGDTGVIVIERKKKDGDA